MKKSKKMFFFVDKFFGVWYITCANAKGQATPENTRVSQKTKSLKKIKIFVDKFFGVWYITCAHAKARERMIFEN